jgi:hypothetical protein
LLSSLVVIATAAPILEGAELDDISRCVLTSTGRIETLFYDLEMFSRGADASEQTDRCLMALRNDRCFVDFVHFANIYSDPWLDHNRARSWSDLGGTTTLRLFGRNAYRAGPESVPEQRASPYSQAIGWQPPGGAKRADRIGAKPFYLDEVFSSENLPKLRIEPVQSVIDGRPCIEVVANEGSDRLWLCPDLGYALVRRIFRPSQADGFTVEYRNADFLPVEDGLWLPKLCKGEFRQSGDEKVHHSFRLRASALAVNGSIHDAIFQPDLPPGTHIYDEEDRLIGSVPGGKDLLDLWIIVGLKLFPPQGRAVLIGDQEMRWGFAWGTVMLVLGLAAAARSRLARFPVDRHFVPPEVERRV